MMSDATIHHANPAVREGHRFAACHVKDVYSNVAQILDVISFEYT